MKRKMKIYDEDAEMTKEMDENMDYGDYVKKYNNFSIFF